MKIPHALKRFLPKSAFVKNVGMLVGGTAIGQVITVLASPLLTRIYTPEDFGTLAVFASFLGIAAVIASLRYELALPLPEDNETAANLLVLSLLVVVAVALAIGAVAWFFGGDLVETVNASQLGPYLWLLPLGIIGSGAYQVFSFWAVRKKAFKHIAQTKLNQSIGQVITQLALGLTINGPVGLLVGQVVGQATGSTTLITMAWRDDGQSLRAVSISRMGRAASRYRRFALLSSGAACLNALGLQLPVLLLSGLYGPQPTGWFVLAQRVLATPLDLVGRAVAQVYFGELAYLIQRSSNSKAFVHLSKKVIKYQLVLGVILVVPIAILAPWFFPIVFGSNWNVAGLYLQILAPMLVAQFVSNPLGTVLDVLERQDLHLARECLRIGLVAGGILLAARIGGPATAISFVSIAGILGYCGGIALAWYAVVRKVMQSEAED